MLLSQLQLCSDAKQTMVSLQRWVCCLWECTHWIPSETSTGSAFLDIGQIHQKVKGVIEAGLTHPSQRPCPSFLPPHVYFNKLLSSFQSLMMRLRKKRLEQQLASRYSLIYSKEFSNLPTLFLMPLSYFLVDLCTALIVSYLDLFHPALRSICKPRYLFQALQKQK